MFLKYFDNRECHINQGIENEDVQLLIEQGEISFIANRVTLIKYNNGTANCSVLINATDEKVAEQLSYKYLEPILVGDWKSVSK